MLRLGLEPITSANFFVTLFTCQPKTERFKNDAFQNAPILKLFSKVSVFINVFGCLEWMTGEKVLCFQTKTQKFGRSLKERCKRQNCCRISLFSEKNNSWPSYKVFFFFKTHRDCDSHCRKHSWLLSSVDIVKKSRHKCRAKLLMSLCNDLYIDLP